MYEGLFRYGNKCEPVDPVMEKEKPFIIRSYLNIPNYWWTVQYQLHYNCDLVKYAFPLAHAEGCFI